MYKIFMSIFLKYEGIHLKFPQSSILCILIYYTSITTVIIVKCTSSFVIFQMNVMKFTNIMN
jgi:hypothetical protein